MCVLCSMFWCLLSEERLVNPSRGTIADTYSTMTVSISLGEEQKEEGRAAQSVDAEGLPEVQKIPWWAETPWFWIVSSVLGVQQEPVYSADSHSDQPPPWAAGRTASAVANMWPPPGSTAPGRVSCSRGPSSFTCSGTTPPRQVSRVRGQGPALGAWWEGGETNMGRGRWLCVQKAEWAPEWRKARLEQKMGKVQWPQWHMIRHDYAGLPLVEELALHHRSLVGGRPAHLRYVWCACLSTFLCSSRCYPDRLGREAV